MNGFCAMNTPRLQAGLARIDDAPTTQTGTTLTPITAITFDSSDTEWSITINGSDEWTLTGGSLFLYEGGPRNVTRLFYKGPYRFLERIAGNTATPPSGVTPSVSNMTSVVAGQRVYLRAVAQAADGRMSVPQLMQAVAVA
jgi:hypothetical protein